MECVYVAPLSSLVHQLFNLGSDGIPNKLEKYLCQSRVVRSYRYWPLTMATQSMERIEAVLSAG